MRLRRTWPERLVILVNVVAMTAALFTAWALSEGEAAVAAITRVDLGGSLTPRSTEDGSSGRAFNVLLVGYDSASNLDPDDPIQIGRKGEQFGDVIIIARIDEEAGSAQLLSLPRDLWVPISGLDEERKINQAFAVGGAAMLIDTIEDNFGIPINNFVSVDLSGFEGLVSVVDHVDLYFENPSRDFMENPPTGEPRSMSGFDMPRIGCQSLSPSNALAFVRSRNFQVLDPESGGWVYDIEQSDLSRIRRQQTFVEAFIARAIDLGARNPFVLSDLVDEAIKHVVIDQELTPQMLLDLGRTFESFEPEELESYSLPTAYARLEDANRTSIVRALDAEVAPLALLMQGVPESDPRTVGLGVRADLGRIDEALALSAGLAKLGFDETDPAADDTVPPGVIVSFGPDGRQAAEVVVAALAEVGVTIDVLVEDPLIRGREIDVTLGSSSDRDSTNQVGAPSTVTTIDQQSPSEGPGSSETAVSTTTQPPAQPLTSLPETEPDAPIVVESIESVHPCP